MSVPFTGSGAASRAAALLRLLPPWYDQSPGAPVAELLRAVGEELDRVAGEDSEFTHVRDGFSLAKATDADLTTLARNLGINRVDATLVSDDEKFRKIVQLLGWGPKQISTLVDEIMHVLYSEEFLVSGVGASEAASLTCANAQTYDLNGTTLTTYINGVPYSVTFAADGMTAEEVITRLLTNFRYELEIDMAVTSDLKVQLSAKYRGSRSNIRVTGTAVGAAPKLNFSTSNAAGVDAACKITLLDAALTTGAYVGHFARNAKGELREIQANTTNEITLVEPFSEPMTPGDRCFLVRWGVWETAANRIVLVVPYTGAPSATYLLAATTVAGAGTVSSSGTAVTGTGTAFLTAASVGGYIVSGGQTRRIVSISSNTALVTEGAFSPALSGAAYTLSTPISGTTGGYPDPSYMYADASDDGPPHPTDASDTLLADDDLAVTNLVLNIFNKYVRAAGVRVRVERLGVL